ncbi:type II secretion system secretin GspD [uncultured Piscinibacter sp.]|uniref:type II secretion system secretin GspD n=1 Tax=uncultured Piscinibacter sp. TaxID=1131835 RepID=UPI002610EA81|nr:type II secretion system secretin GspD [uncultured Piscinibacter sp.]
MKSHLPSGPLPRRWPARLAVALLSAALVPPPGALAQTARGRFAGGEPVTLNFVNADIDAVSRAMGAILKQQFVVDPRVKGQITLFSEQPITPREAYLNYLAALRGLGFTVVEVGGLFKVVPEADAKLQTGTVAVGETGRRGDQILTQVFKLNHENANNLVPVLRPLISPNNTINANPGNNSLVITDYADNLQRIAKIIAAMDTPAAGEVEVIPLRHAVAADLAPLVQRLSDSGGAVVVPGAPVIGGAASSIIADSRNNTLLVKAGSPARMASIRSLVERLDQPPQGQAAVGNVWVVHLKNADATKLAQVLRAAFAGGSGGGSGAAALSPTPTSAVTAAQPAITAGGASPQSTTPVSASAGPSTGGFIQADPSSNSLVITAAEPLYRQVRAMIDQLDSRRAQVYIESMIVEVSGDNAADFGFQWQGLAGSTGDKYGVFAGTNTSIGGPSIVALTQTLAGQGTTLPGEGFNIGLLKNYGGTYALAAVARALQTQANTNIVSTPNLITLDNEEAKIVVGENVPFITGQFTNTGTATTNPFQTIERKDVGITLRIKPQIGEGGTVRMTIYQEQSSVKATTAAGTSNAGPSTTKRSIESTVVVDDGAILVLGGLINETYTDTKSKVPLLGDIPFFGALFRSEKREKNRSNLMVFLKPTIMRDSDSSSRLSLDRYDLIRANQKDAQPASNPFLPLKDSPVIPPMRAPSEPAAAAAPAAPASGASAP